MHLEKKKKKRNSMLLIFKKLIFPLISVSLSSSLVPLALSPFPALRVTFESSEIDRTKEIVVEILII